MDKPLRVYAAKTGIKQKPWVQISGRSKAKKSETERGSHSVKVQLWEGKLNFLPGFYPKPAMLIMAVRMAEARTLILLLTDVEKTARILQHVTGESFSFLSLHGIPFLGK